MERCMKKIGILLAILLVAGVCAMADEAVPAVQVVPAVQGADLFADIDAVVLSAVEMEAVDGGQHPDMDGSTMYGPYSKVEVKNSDWIKGGVEPIVSISVSLKFKL
jgi:uncharacterized protein involved in high-affinity Fe2+ transport